MFYSSPWKDNPFGKITGDKRLDWFRVHLEEAKVYQSNDGYCIAGLIKPIAGVIHKMDGSFVLEPVMVELLIHEKDYETRVKDTEASKDSKNKYKSVPVIASVFEQELCRVIKKNPQYWQPGGKMLTGTIEFLPDLQFENIGSQHDLISQKVISSCSLKEIEPSGKIPKWEQKTYRSGNSNYSKGISLDEKVTFIKQELIAATGKDDNKETDSIGQLLASFHNQVAPVDDTEYARNYLMLLRAIVS